MESRALNRQRRCGWLVLGMLGLSVLVVGCRAAAEPASELRPITHVDHEFRVVWECLLEAFQAEGFSPERAPIASDGGYIESSFKPLKVDPITRRESALRLRAQVSRDGDEYEVRLAASRFEREAGARHWGWVARDQGLSDRIHERFDEAVSKRYRR